MTYPFVCESCGEFELELKPSQIPLKQCPRCKGDKVERVFHPVKTVYKTGGFYTTDSRKGEQI